LTPTRSAAIMRVMRRPSTIAYVVAASSLAALMAQTTGCKKKESAGEAAGESGQGAQAVVAAAPRAGDAGPKRRELHPKFRRRSDAMRAQMGLETLTIEEVAPLVPALSGATPVGKPSLRSRGRRVNVVRCVPTDNVRKIEQDLKQKLTALGFSETNSSVPDSPKRLPKELLKVTSQKGQYALTAMLQSAQFRDCPADKKKTMVVMAYFKRSRSQPAGAPASEAKDPGAPAPKAAAREHKGTSL
jgi:hypothetical protein